MNKFFVFIFFLAPASVTQAQVSETDSIKTQQLGEVVVTATKNPKQLSDLPLSVTVVTKDEIKSSGALRLSDILSEQTGLSTVSDFGKGIQMQGLDPQYTLVLIDGEPVTGRLAGSINLSSITTKNIKQIEIMKGPLSALYGSDAIAGVVNIITNDSTNADASLSLQYGSNETLDIAADVTAKSKNTRIYFFADRNSSGGYDFYPALYGYTSNPYTAYSFRTKITNTISERSKISLSGSYNTELQEDKFQNNSDKIDGSIKKTEWSINPVFTYLNKSNLKFTIKGYAAHYVSASEYTYNSNGELFEEDDFRQTYLKPEVQADYSLNNHNLVTAGAGHTDELVSSNRYSEEHHFATNYFFLQYQWSSLQKLKVIAGGRIDAHSEYSAQISPKISLQYDVFKPLLVRFSAGRGYKTPDLRQLYLNFYNPLVGYNVFGVYELADGISELQEQGQIAALLVDPNTIQNIKPESSTAVSAGIVYQKEKFKAEINFFRNDLTDLIETQLIARKTNGQFVYSYTNLNKIYTEGVEVNSGFRISKSFFLSAGYQLLIAKDKSVIENIADGQVFSRDPVTLVSRKVKQGEYGGLFNRSRHSGNIKLAFADSKKGISANVRAPYKGKYGYSDLNGNSILDADNEYVDGYVLLNAGIAKSFRNSKYEIRFGVDNITDFRNVEFIPDVPGRIWHASFILNFSKKK
jgi:outer membrane receptor for ferrienterochelin and colicins